MTEDKAQAEIAQRVEEAAARALAEADARRAANGRSEGGREADGEAQAQEPAELGGRDGPSPTRFGDWEKKGLAIDF